MDTKTYIPRTKPEIEAVQWDGTKAQGYQILSWIYGSGRSARLDDGYSVQGPDVLILHVDGHDEIAISGNWIIKDVDGDFSILKQEDLDTLFVEGAPAPSVIRELNVRINHGISALYVLNNSGVGKAKVFSDQTIVIDLAADPNGEQLYGYLVNDQYRSEISVRVEKRVLR